MKNTNPAGEGEKTVASVVAHTTLKSPARDSDSDGLYADENQETTSKGATTDSGKTHTTLNNSLALPDDSKDEELGLMYEDLSFEKGKRTSRFTTCVCVLLALLSIAFAVETYFFVQVLNKTKVLEAENQRLMKTFEKEKSELKANKDEIMSERDVWKNKFEEEEKKQSENQHQMQRSVSTNSFLNCIKEMSQESISLRNHALYAAVYAKSIDTVSFLVDCGALPGVHLKRKFGERSALELTASESSDASSAMMALLCKNQNLEDHATECLKIHMKLDSPNAQIVKLLVDTKVIKLDLFRENPFTIALCNANVGFPVYQELVRAFQGPNKLVVYGILKEAYFLKSVKRDSQCTGLDNLIQALEEVNDPSDVQSLQESASACQNWNGVQLLRAIETELHQLK